MDALPQPINSLLDQTSHRPYPRPDRPWLYHMVWEHLMFLHYRVDAFSLRPFIPPELELDLHDGQAWVSAVGLQVKDVILHVFPYTRLWLRFLNLDFLTYVKRQGRPGIWFFSLDASTPLMATGGRGGFQLPYHKGNLRLERQKHRHRWVFSRAHDAGIHLECHGSPAGSAAHARAGSLDHWFIERYCIYTQNPRGHLLRSDVHRLPFLIQPAQVEVHSNTLGHPLGLPLGPPDLAHFCPIQQVLGWMHTRVDPRR